MKDYYSILGVSKEADEVVIRAAYKALAQKYHPDKASPELKAKYTDLMKEINEAYSVLSQSSRGINQNSKRAKESDLKNPSLHKQNTTKPGTESAASKELPNWIVGSILLGVWIIGYFLIFKFILSKD